VAAICAWGAAAAPGGPAPPTLPRLGAASGVASCEAGSDDTVGYDARIVAATSHARLFDRLASVRDWDGRPTSVTRSDFMRARLFCHMLPSGSLSAVPDAADKPMSDAARRALLFVGDSDGRVPWPEYLVLSALLSMPRHHLRLVLAAGDGDGSGALSHEELSRALALVVGDEVRASALPPSAAVRWPSAGKERAAAAAEGAAGGLWSLEPPAGLARAALAPGACVLPDGAGAAERSADRYDAAGLLALVDALAAAVAELEFRVFADVEADGTAEPAMTAGGFARYVICQSMSGSGETARLLARWEDRLADGGQGPQGAARRGSGQSAFRSTSPADVLDLAHFVGARGALVDRSGDVIASLGFLVGPGSRVGPRELSHAVWATAGAELPRLAAESLLAVASASEGRDSSVATASLAELRALLGSHAGARVGRARGVGDEGGIAACVRASD